MVDDAAGKNDVERFVHPVQKKNVALQAGDVFQPGFVTFPTRIGQTRKTEIDGRNLRVRVEGFFNQNLSPRSASRDQKSERLAGGRVVQGGLPVQTAPAWIGVFLVLGADSAGHVVVGQTRRADSLRYVCLFHWLLNLDGQKRPEGSGEVAPGRRRTQTG